MVGTAVGVMANGGSCLLMVVASTSFSLAFSEFELDFEFDLVFSYVPASLSSSLSLLSSSFSEDYGECGGVLLGFFIQGPCVGVTYEVANFFPRGCFSLGESFF